MLNHSDGFHFQWLLSYVKGPQEGGAASPGRAERGRARLGLRPAEGLMNQLSDTHTVSHSS